jgi:DNA-binding beta-propeller fold protein YncE
MKGAPFAIGLVCWLALRPALALEVVLEPPRPAAIGAPHTLRVARVDGAVGDVTLRWSFGDGTRPPASTSLEASHTYAEVGHYTVIVIASDAQNQRTSASFQQTAHYPLTDLSPTSSSSIVLLPDRREIWSVNPDADSVSVFDEQQLVRLREIAVGNEPQSLARAPDGSVWVANQFSDEIVVIDPASGEVAERIALPYASQPLGLTFGPSGAAYVSLYATGKLLEIDGSTRKLGRELALGPTPAAIAVAADGRIFVTRFLSPDEEGQIWLVSPQSFELVRTIPLAFDPGPDSESSGRGVPNYVSSIVISPDGTQAWVTAKKDDIARGPLRDGLSMNPDNFVRAIVCVIDLQSEAEVLQKRMDVDNRAMLSAIAFSPVGDYAYVAAQGNNWVGIMDAYAARNAGGLQQVGLAPSGLVLTPEGRLLVNAYLSREVSAYDLSASIALGDHAAPPPLARMSSIDVEPLPAQVLEGKRVFFNAADTRMSEVGYMSCVSCHFGGGGDARVWDFTDRGEGLRNTKSLLGTGGTVLQGRVHWSANFDEIQDFERDIRESLGGTGFMPDAAWLEHEADPFGPPSAGISPELDALAAFIGSLTEVPRSPYRNPDGSFTEQALRGRKIFERTGCPECHASPSFSDSTMGDLLLHDVGTLLPTSGMRLGGALPGIDTPTLRGIWQTAPYLHDGRARTLEEVFTTAIPPDRMGMTSQLSSAEVADLVRYLQELDDVPETVAAPEPESEAKPASCSFGAQPARSGLALTGLLVALALAAIKRARARGALSLSQSDSVRT